jgi:hypothetical protein
LLHILTEAHEILMSNGLPSESFQPARRSMDVMAAATRAELEAVLHGQDRDDLLCRPDALPSLTRPEALALLSDMHDNVPNEAQRKARAA